MGKTRSRAPVVFLVSGLILLCLAGCTRNFFRKRADQQVDALLKEKDQYPQWKIEQYHVEPDPRARFASSGNPNRPPMPPDDPAAAELSPNPQRLGRKNAHLMEGNGYLDMLAEWDAINRATAKDGKSEKKDEDGDRKAEKEKKPETSSPSRDPLLSNQNCPRPFRLKLEQAVELGLVNSREFQDRREDLYLTALPVTVERFAFCTQFFMTEELLRERLGKLFPGGPANRWVSNSNVGFSKLFCTGALLLFRFANRTVVEMANVRVPRVISESTINLDVVQPLLRGGGWKVTLEPLTLAERNLLYEIRDYARFRKQFFVALAAGADIGATAIGATRFRNRPTAFGLEDFAPGAELLPGRGVLFGIPVSGNAQASGYLPVVLNQSLLENERSNVARLEYFLQLFQAFQRADQVPQLQVDRVEQQLLQGRSNAFQRDQALRETLDRFKLQLGVPTDLPLELEDEPVQAQRQQFRSFQQIIDLYEKTRDQASALDRLTDPSRLRVELQKLATTSELVQGTQFRQDFLRRWGLWQQPPLPELPLPDRDTPLLERRLSLLDDQRKAIQKKIDELEDAQKPADGNLARQLRELTVEIDVLRFELSLRAYEEALRLQQKVRGARIASATAAFASPTPFSGLPLLGPGVGELRNVVLSRFNEVFDNFERGVLIEARNERLEKVRKQWPELPRVCVEGVDVLTADLDNAEAVVARTALANRFDLMNVRAQLMDAWRQIAVAANGLLGVFNIEYHLTSLTPPGRDRPFAFDGSRSRHQLAFTGELPLVRVVERNNYRASLIGWQRQRRTLMATEDTIVLGVRAQIRQLRVLAENYRIAQRAVELAYLQVENSLDVFRTPPLPTGPTIDSPALTQQLLEAQRNLIEAQNRLVTFWVQYLTTRMQLYRDLELLPLNPHGAWIDDVATCECPPAGTPSPAESLPDAAPEVAPKPRKIGFKVAPVPGT